MEIIIIILSALSLCLSLLLVILFILSKKKATSLNEADLKQIKDASLESINKLSVNIAELVSEKNKTLMSTLLVKIDELEKEMKSLTEKQEKLLKENNEFNEKFFKDNEKQKEETSNKLSLEMKKISDEIKEKFEDFKKNTSDAIKLLNETVSNSLKEIREDNNIKLEKINESVNEKLQKTLENKLKDSFDNVIKQIGSVNTAIGEIKGLATDVGSLKNVLTNVKTKGIMGEVILGNIIREFLTTSQYEENVSTKEGSNDRVEFAIKLPGNQDQTIYLPIDSKFPYEPYSKILESNDPEEILSQRKLLRNNLLKYAKDVSEKYIDAPNTTDFAVIFLPLEGLYLEALNMGLFEEIQSKYKVNITGPTTFTAFINSLQMGFKSLMIQKKSADVFKLLAAVKTEFAKFAEALEKTQKKMSDASNDLESLVGTRTRMLNSKLKGVEMLDEKEAETFFIEDNNK